MGGAGEEVGSDGEEGERDGGVVMGWGEEV